MGSAVSSAAGAAAFLRERLARVYSDADPGDPILKAFQEVVRDRRIPACYPEELLEGLAMGVPVISTALNGARPRVPQLSSSDDWNQPRCWSEPSR